MKKPFIAIISSLALLALFLAPAHSVVYVWKDAQGVTNFTDDRANVPDGVRFEVRTYGGPSAAVEPPAQSAVTQGQFARELAAELGLGSNLTEEQAADSLSRVRIGPPLGEWELDAPLTGTLLSRLRKLTVGAAQAGFISLAPEEALFAFDSATSLLGVAVRRAARPRAPAPAQPAASVAPVTIYVIPPPPVIYERTIFVGGGAINNPFLLPGALPVVLPEAPLVQINNRISNDNRVINKRVVIVRPRQLKPNRPRVVQPTPDRLHAGRATLASVPWQRVIRPVTIFGKTGRFVTPTTESTGRVVSGRRIVSARPRTRAAISARTVTGGAAISRAVR